MSNHPLTGSPSGHAVHLPGRSWGGASVCLLALSLLAYAALGKVVDGNIQIEDAAGRTYIYEGGSVGSTLALLLLAAAFGAACMALVVGRTARLAGSGFTILMGLCMAWWLVGSGVWRRGSADPVELLLVPVGVLLALGAVMDPPRMSDLRFLNVLRDVGAVGALGVSVLMPALGQLPCRSDKCGLFGSMWTGFFYHENVAATSFIILLPLAVIYRYRWQQAMAVSLVAVLVAGSGSRTAYLALAAAVGFLVLYPWWMRSGVPRLVRSLSVVAYALSTLLFLDVLPLDLTGRDWVFGAIRDSLTGYGSVFGPGSPELSARTGGWIVGEHGLAPHLLLQLGIVGFVLFGMGLIAFAAKPRSVRFANVLGAAFVLVPVSRSLTEPGLMFQTRTMDFLALVLAMSLLSLDPVTPPAREDKAERLRALGELVQRLRLVDENSADHGSVGAHDRAEAAGQFVDVNASRRHEKDQT